MEAFFKDLRSEQLQVIREIGIDYDSEKRAAEAKEQRPKLEFFLIERDGRNVNKNNKNKEGKGGVGKHKEIADRNQPRIAFFDQKLQSYYVDNNRYRNRSNRQLPDEKRIAPNEKKQRPKESVSDFVSSQKPEDGEN